MNREIKFRAWDKERERFVFIEARNKNLHEFWFDSFSTEGQMEPLQQFTGLKDKNGKDVYEGDIDERRMEIVCGNQFGQVSIRTKGTIFHEIWNIENKEIIGNIYEYPSLPANLIL